MGMAGIFWGTGFIAFAESVVPMGSVLVVSALWANARMWNRKGIWRAGARLRAPAREFLGATESGIKDAFTVIADPGGPEGIVARAAQPIPSGSRGGKDDALLVGYPAAVRIVLEMSTHEHVERRALEDQLALLRNDWQEAEETASIAARLP